MNFDLTPDQKMLSETVGAFVKRESPVGRFRAMREDPVGYSTATWKQMGELGWLGLLVPEEQGGFGGTLVDAAILLEHFGTTLVPEPYVPSVVLAGTALSRAGTEEQRARWLAPLVSGDTTLALAYAERAGRFDVTSVATTAAASEGGYRLDGEKIFVANGHAANAFVVSAVSKAGLSMFVVDRDLPGVEVRPIKTMDGQRAATVRFTSVQVGNDARLGADGSAASLLEALMDLGAAAACAEAVGVMSTALTMTRDYLCTREQFGVKIGSFQALQHRAVDMFVEVELARSMAILASIAAWERDGADRASGVSAAKVQIAQSGRFVTQHAIQLHGGIGITDEHDIGLYFKRMHVLGTLFGDEEHHVARYASLPTGLAGGGGPA